MDDNPLFIPKARRDVMSVVINGVFARKVGQITEELCGNKFSKSTVSTLCKNLDPMVEAFRT